MPFRANFFDKSWFKTLETLKISIEFNFFAIYHLLVSCVCIWINMIASSMLQVVFTFVFNFSRLYHSTLQNIAPQHRHYWLRHCGRKSIMTSTMLIQVALKSLCRINFEGMLIYTQWHTVAINTSFTPAIVERVRSFIRSHHISHKSASKHLHRNLQDNERQRTTYQKVS